MSAAELLQPDPEPAQAPDPEPQKPQDDEDDDDMDLAALRAAALSSIKPKKPAYELQKHPKRSNLLEIVPAGGQPIPTQPQVSNQPPVIPVRFDRPPPGYPYHQVVPAAPPPLLSFPPPLPQYYGNSLFSSPTRRRSRSPYHSRTRRRYSRSPSPRYAGRDSYRRYESASDSASEEEIEEEVEVTATESEGEPEEKKEEVKKEEDVAKAPETEEADDFVNVHADVDEFSSLLESNETEPETKKKKTKIIKRIVKRKKVRSFKRRPLSPRRRSRSPVGRQRNRSPHGWKRRSPSPTRGRQDSLKSDLDKSKSLPPPLKRRSISKGASEKDEVAKPKETAEEKEERLFKERLAKARTPEERDRMIARRNKFQTTPLKNNSSKVISLKEAKRPEPEEGDQGVDDTLEEDKNDDEGVTDLRVQLHRKRMMRGSKEGRKRETTDSEDKDWGKKMSKIVRSIKNGSGSEDEDLRSSSVIPKRSNIMSRLGQPVHHHKVVKSSEDEEPVREEKRIYIEENISSGGEEQQPPNSSSPDGKKAKKKKKKENKRERKLEKKLEKKFKKLKEQVTSMRGEAEKSDKIDKLLSSASLSDILSSTDASSKSKAKKKSKKKEDVTVKSADVDESEEALFAFFENEAS